MNNEKDCIQWQIEYVGIQNNFLSRHICHMYAGSTMDSPIVLLQTLQEPDLMDAKQNYVTISRCNDITHGCWLEVTTASLTFSYKWF